MPLDDDDNPALAAALPLPSAVSSSTSPPADAAAEALTADDLIEDEGAASQDFRLFRKNAHVSAQTIRKGEKDFESHGTRAQAGALEQSRAAMRDVLSYTRVHTGAAASRGNPARGWYFPGWWESYEEEGETETQEDGGKGVGEKQEKRPFGYIRERVVVLEGSSVASMNLGRAVTGQARDRPAKGKDWLLPEEALYLVERGSLDLWWPTKGLEEIFPPEGAAKASGEDEEGPEEADEYDMGFPLSLQAAYALLIGHDGERGKISLQKFQVYSNLKRCGYNVLRAPPIVRQPNPPTTPSTLWQWLTCLLSSATQHKPYGPLVQPGLYRSYASIYQQMALLPLHKPSPFPSDPHNVPNDPFTLHFHIWKSAQKWTKLRHPPPDFYLSVVDAQESAVPTLEGITALLDDTPPAPGKPEWAGPGRMYTRLKHGHRNVLVAVVDHGVINYMRFAEAAFGEEKLYERFDTRGAPKGKKGGGRWGWGKRTWRWERREGTGEVVM
ncbi:putative tRNA-splicing endonuclease subunit tsp-5 [Madurella mycetomatis]|uniref:tRNA-splicing endonuclease subunit tsp-5 n=1 Tax=Madurella mycetomatis TaxID=100816 RepID=A0A175WG50_9PEZI|nr:putative tRNA-splicing endonuclease subunit tsp-5 [Madurella mycetomatis]